ncbi:enolase C-terminal domain-like protein [Bdellovibrio sp. HCB185ZH]|uniref:enolase C-terminal domain-like protein n=1 Tax=Bdellovibrio sp. HCB185ZH TaxID=3394235 RepID=UPI0039A56451
MSRELRFAMDEIPFKIKFSHATFEREASSTLWVTLKSNGVEGLGESCPRPYVTGETTETVTEFFRDPRAQKFADASSPEELSRFISEERRWLDQNPSAFCALELAWWDLYGKIKNQSVENFFPGAVRRVRPHNTMVIGLGTPKKMLKTYLRGLFLGFRDFKIKVSPNSVKQLIQFLNHPTLSATKFLIPKIRLDANNSFASYKDLQSVLSQIPFEIWAIEEPFAVDNHEAQTEFLEKSKSLLILDESFITVAGLEKYRTYFSRICLNVRISKLGGLMRTQEALVFAQKNKILWGLGCQVGETSLLARAGLLILHKNAHRPLFWEGAFSDHLLSYDPFTPKIKLGPWGKLSGEAKLKGPGLNLTPLKDHFKKFFP